MIDKCFRECHFEHFHTFENKCIYDIQLKNIGNKERLNSEISDKELNLYELKNYKKCSTEKFCIQSNE